MARALKVCPVPNCHELVAQGRCQRHASDADRARGTASERGYNTAGHLRRFRPGVLERDPLCVICEAEGLPPRLATIADHWPLSRRELIEQGLDPDDPQNGRGLCKPHHDRSTAANPQQRGGWNNRYNPD